MATVLVVDDNSDILSAVSEALTEEGWDVVAALSADEAMPKAQARRIDVVLCDVLLGDTEGPDLRGRFAQQGFGHIPFVFVTASTRKMDGLAGELTLRKPFAVSEVLKILRAALSGPDGELPDHGG